MEVILVIIVLMIYIAIVGHIASSLNRSVVGWVLLCLFLSGPGLLLLAYVASKQTVKCPHCGRMFTVEKCAVHSL